MAGQTAPSPGITIRNYGFYLSTNDVLMQHFRIRPGGATCNSGLQAYGGDQSQNCPGPYEFQLGSGRESGLQLDQRAIDGCHRVSVDYGRGAVSRSRRGRVHWRRLFERPRHFDRHQRQRVTVIQSLFANNWERNPYMQGDTATTLLNNLVYQWHGPWGFFYNNGSVRGPGCGTNDPWYSSVVGNRFVKGPYTCCTGGGD